MIRCICPPREALDALRTPLTEGENRVLDFFDRLLPEGWEIYVQPHLNGLRPDFVLLHPVRGIAVFEVKDWNLDAMPYAIRTDGSSLSLWCQNRDGKWFRRTDNPVERVVQYKQDILDLYCPHLGSRLGEDPDVASVVTAGVIMPTASTRRVQTLFHPFQAYFGLRGKKAEYYPLVGGDTLDPGDLYQVFPWAAQQRKSRWMSDHLAKDLRSWLIEPEHAATQREPLELNVRQRELATTRTLSGYRRVRGAAGCGKSLALAARAAELSADRKDVLVVTFNMTLLHYLRDLAFRYPHPRTSIINRITWVHFHGWCKRVCQEAGMDQQYRRLWRGHLEGEVTGVAEGPPDDLLETDLPGLVESAIHDGGRSVSRYDAILVDEGQDFNLTWWNLLRQVLNPGGEMMLVADTTQDLYGRSSRWTESRLENAGFRGGPWYQLEGSYRFPPSFVPYVRQFIEQFIPNAEGNLPTAIQGELFEHVRLQWLQVSEGKAVEACVQAVCELPQFAAPLPVAWADITLLVGSHRMGLQCLEKLKAHKIQVSHVFGTDHVSKRQRKMRFWMGDGRMKGATVHSFKGWECRAMVIFIGRSRTQDDLSAAYVALSRLKRSAKGSVLSVVCTAPELEEYGKTWPEFRRL